MLFDFHPSELDVTYFFMSVHVAFSQSNTRLSHVI
jgi:hypothetical protein